MRVGKQAHDEPRRLAHAVRHLTDAQPFLDRQSRRCRVRKKRVPLRDGAVWQGGPPVRASPRIEIVEQDAMDFQASRKCAYRIRRRLARYATASGSLARKSSCSTTLTIAKSFSALRFRRWPALSKSPNGSNTLLLSKVPHKQVGHLAACQLSRPGQRDQQVARGIGFHVVIGQPRRRLRPVVDRSPGVADTVLYGTTTDPVSKAWPGHDDIKKGPARGP